MAAEIFSITVDRLKDTPYKQHPSTALTVDTDEEKNRSEGNDAPDFVGIGL